MSKSSLIVSAGLVGALVLGACGCSASSETTTTVETSVTDDEGTKTTKTTTTSDSDGNTTTTTDESVVLSIDEWTDAWIGDTDRGYGVYYAQAPAGTSQACLVLYNKADSAIEYSFVGDYEVPQEGVVTLTDAVSGDSVTFEALEQSEEQVVLDLGDEIGTGTLDTCTMADFIDNLREIDTNGQVLSE